MSNKIKSGFSLRAITIPSLPEVAAETSNSPVFSKLPFTKKQKSSSSSIISIFFLVHHISPI